MSNTEIYESLLVEVSTLGRAEIVDRLSRFPGELKLDFSAEYLARCDDERLRHLLLAALWRCQMKVHAGNFKERIGEASSK